MKFSKFAVRSKTFRMIFFAALFLSFKPSFSQSPSPSVPPPLRSPGPVTQIDKVLNRFITLWGDDILLLKKAKTIADFEALVPKMKLTAAEAKMIQRFQTTSIAATMKNLIIAFPRSKFGDGVALAMKSYLESLAIDKVATTTAFSNVIKSYPLDPVAEERSIILDLFKRIPGINPNFQAFLKTALKDSNLSLVAGSLEALGRGIYGVTLFHNYLDTMPDPAEASALLPIVVSNVNFSSTQKTDLTQSLNDYLSYAEAFLSCSAGVCKRRVNKDGVCSAQSPCVSGLQCYGGKCVDLLPVGGRCGTGYPVCHPTLTCSGNATSLVRTCVSPAKVGQSCADKACDRGLSCLKQAKVCVQIASVGQACAGASRPCEQNLSCVKGLCKTKGSLSQTCGAGDPCVDSLYCTNLVSGGVCADKKNLGEACGSNAPCKTGLTCHSVVSSQGTVSTCKSTSKFGEACGLTSFCDASLGLICGANSICRNPANSGEACQAIWECAQGQGLFCLGAGTQKTCRTAGGVGAYCESSDHCVSDTYCDLRASASTKNRCIAKGAEGSDCPCNTNLVCTPQGAGAASICRRPGSAGESCGVNYPDCKADANLVCVGRSITTSGTCKTLGGVGASCGGQGINPPCLPGLVCQNGSWASPGICRALGSVGSTCISTDPPCGSGLFCNATQRCVAGGTQGTACTGTWGVPCAEGFSCSDASGAPGPVKCTSACVTDNSCLGDNYACRIVDVWGRKSCVMKLSYGSPCVSDTDSRAAPCGNALFCSPTTQVCEFRAGRGEVCDPTYIPCAFGSGICRLATDGRLRCQ